MMEECIKQGQLERMKEEFPFVLQGVTRNDWATKSANRIEPPNLRYLRTSYASPTAHTTRGLFSDDADIPLRVQLDQNATMKQRVVNKEFETLCLQLLQQKQEEMQAKRKENIKKWQLKEEKAEKYFQQEKKNQEKTIKKQAEHLNQTLEAKQRFLKEQRRKKEKEQREFMEKVQRQRQEDCKRKEQKRKDQMERQFQNDLKDISLKADKKGAYQQQIKMDSIIIQQKIEKTEEQYICALRKKELEMVKLAERAKRHSVDVTNVYAVRKVMHQVGEEKRIAEVVYNHMKREKRKPTFSLDAHILKEKNEAHMTQVKERLSELRKEDKIQKARILEQQKQRESVAETIRHELTEADRDYFEILKLKKLDQSEAYNREKFTFMLEKQKNAIRIQDKALRIDILKSQQARILQMLSNQNNPLASNNQAEFKTE